MVLVLSVLDLTSEAIFLVRIELHGDTGSTSILLLVTGRAETRLVDELDRNFLLVHVVPVNEPIAVLGVGVESGEPVYKGFPEVIPIKISKGFFDGGVDLKSKRLVDASFVTLFKRIEKGLEYWKSLFNVPSSYFCS